MSKGTIIAFLVVVAVVVAGYWAYQSQTSEEPVEEVETELIDETAEVIVGETLTITLDANLTTGYQWEVGYEAASLDFTKRVYTPAGGVMESETPEENEETILDNDEPMIDEDNIDDVAPPVGTEVIINEEPVSTSTNGEIVGAGGQEEFSFLAKQAGETTITFSYLRPWETDIAPIKQIIYTVTVVEPSEDEEENEEEPTE